MLLTMNRAILLLNFLFVEAVRARMRFFDVNCADFSTDLIRLIYC